MWVAIHKCMEARLGISMYSYLYHKVAKTICLSYYLLCFLFNKIGEEGGTSSAWKQGIGGGRGVRGRWHKQCVHMLVNAKTIKQKDKEEKGSQTLSNILQITQLS
jgi:hypothetical protein